jgi:tRNA modification GTPase
LKDTIIALATPAGTSAIAALRVSGKAVQAICKEVLPGFKMQPRMASLIKAKSPAVIDELLAIYFPAPNSYTGEDVLELYPHGNPFIVRKLVEAICKVPGVRLAERGEFTERAFLNGKMDLTQAEAIGSVLHARDAKSLSNAHRLLSGEVSEEIKALAESIKEISALLELEVDFAEDISVNSDSPNLHISSCEKILHHLQNLKKRFRKSGSELPCAVMFGAPNAGKSSLINALVGESRLLVSEAPGTTRDFVEVPLHLPSGDILLIDTAGLANQAQSEIDKQAMQKSRENLKRANLKILVIDISAPLPKEFEEWAKQADLVVETHIDIAETSTCNLHVSATEGTGINELQNTLNTIFFPETEENEEAWIVSERQIACIKKAEEGALRALEQLKQAQTVELAAFEMRQSRNALCSITGEISDESVLEAIFGSYCIGK